MNIRYIIGGVIVVVFIVWGASAFLRTTIQYVPIAEALDKERTVQVMGAIDFSTVNYDAEQATLEFDIYDTDATDPTSADRMKIVYHGVIPGNFEQATSVVVKGRASGDFFAAQQLLVKCPSKYQGGGEGYQDMRQHDEAQESKGA